MPHKHRVVLVVWSLVIASVPLALAIDVPALVTLAVIASMITALVTYHCVIETTLIRRGPYFVAVGLLLVAAALTAAVAGHTFAMSPGKRFGCEHAFTGLAGIATVSLVAAILAWRAFVHPSPRRAARAGMIVVVFESIAMVFDMLLTFHLDPANDAYERWLLLGFVGAALTTCAGVVSCIVSLVSAGPPRHELEIDVPAARIVGTDARS